VARGVECFRRRDQFDVRFYRTVSPVNLSHISIHIICTYLGDQNLRSLKKIGLNNRILETNLGETVGTPADCTCRRLQRMGQFLRADHAGQHQDSSEKAPKRAKSPVGDRRQSLREISGRHRSHRPGRSRRRAGLRGGVIEEAAGQGQAAGSKRKRSESADERGSFLTTGIGGNDVHAHFDCSGAL
jgi:hypothetical protein